MSYSKANLREHSLPRFPLATCLFFCFSTISNLFPTPSNPPGRVLGFQIPALKYLHLNLSTHVLFNTCSSVSALHGPAIILDDKLNSSNQFLISFLIFHLF
jgi:hypothetical protein